MLRRKYGDWLGCSIAPWKRKVRKSSVRRSQPRAQARITVQRLSRGGVEDFEEEIVNKPNGDFDVLESKKALRASLLRDRLRLTAEEVWSRSSLIAQNVFGLHSFRSARKVALYYPIKNEVSTHLLFQRSRDLGKEVFYPRIHLSQLEFVRVDDIQELTSGGYGILEPTHNSSDKIDVRELDLVFIPGIGFDPKGNRLGYGKGYYDRALSSVERSRRVGLAFVFQIADSVPRGLYDEPVGVVVTEDGVIFC